jgi:hypothetical protein
MATHTITPTANPMLEQIAITLMAFPLSSLEVIVVSPRAGSVKWGSMSCCITDGLLLVLLTRLLRSALGVPNGWLVTCVLDGGCTLGSGLGEGELTMGIGVDVVTATGGGVSGAADVVVLITVTGGAVVVIGAGVGGSGDEVGIPAADPSVRSPTVVVMTRSNAMAGRCLSLPCMIFDYDIIHDIPSAKDSRRSGSDELFGL